MFGVPIMTDHNIIERKIAKFYIDNPDYFVFVIVGLEGYWAIDNKGKIVRLVHRWGKIRGASANKFLYTDFGDDYINDMINDRFLIGHRYYACPDCKVKKPMYVKLEKL